MSLDLAKDILDDKIRKAKELSKPADATPLLHLITNPNLSVDDRKLLAKVIEDTNTKMGLALLERALADGTLTDAEWLDMQSKGMTPMGIATTLQAHYAKRDGLTDPDESVVVVTDPSEPAYALRELFLEKFNVLLVSPAQALDLLQKRDAAKTTDELKVKF
jgi:hypothetical protein